jgi:hypothetical protein
VDAARTSINSSSHVAQSQSNRALQDPVAVSPNYAPTQPHPQDPNHTEQDHYHGHHVNTAQSTADNTRPCSAETGAAHARSAKEAQERCVEMESRVAELTDRLQAMRVTMQRRKTEVVAQWKALVTAQNK